MTDKNKITYGVCNVHVWPIISTSDAGVPTYGTKIKVPGATEMSLDAEGDTVKIYGDNVVYYSASVNNGYSGDLTVLNIPETFYKNILGMLEDDNGVLVEDASKNGAEFAMAFEFDGDVSKRRHVFYRCTAGRPQVASQTKEDTIEANTHQISIEAMPRLDNSIVKATTEDNTSDAYSGWYGTAPYAVDFSGGSE